jgi:hypothetical protein
VVVVACSVVVVATMVDFVVGVAVETAVVAGGIASMVDPVEV